MGLSILSIIAVLIRQNLIIGLLKGFFLTTLELRKVTNVSFIYRSIYHVHICNFFKPEISTSFSSLPSEYDYDYLFYRETLINNGEVSENVSGNDTLRFQDLIQVYTRRTTLALVPTSASVPNPAQQSSKTVTAQLLSISTADDLTIALRKGKHNCTQHSISNFISYSHLLSSLRSFISSLDSCSTPKNVSKTQFIAS